MLYFKDADNNTMAIDNAGQMDLVPAGFHQISYEQMLEIAESKEVPDPPPQVVTRFQARAALHAFGMLEQVDEMMNDPQTDVLRRLAWTDAQEFRRTSPTLQAVAEALSLTEQQLDELFTTAAGIEA